MHKNVADMLKLLPELHGSEDCLQRAEKVFSKADQAVKDALAYLQQAVAKFKQHFNDVDVHFDLSELRGYHYHTGILFAAYTPGEGQEIARGGRYDDIGQVFGRARPATGFSTDTKRLLGLTQNESSVACNAILAPCDEDDGLIDKIKELRQQGETVIQSLPGQLGDANDLGCNRELVKSNGKWQVEAC